MEPLVSVVIPIYNVEKYLDRCVSSVVNQTYRNLEIILVDDGSPDNCPAMCDAWAERDSRIRVIHKKNNGQGMARNSGMDIATGKYIFFFDSDDYVAYETVSLCVSSAEKQNADVVMFGFCHVFSDGTLKKVKLDVKQNLFSGESVREVVLPGLFTYDMGYGGSACGKMFRLKLLRDEGIRFASERVIISEDSYFSLEVFNIAQVVFLLPENLYYYYKRDGSFSNTYRWDRQEKINFFLEKCLEYVEGAGLPASVAVHVKARYHIYTLAHLKQTMVANMSMEQRKSKIKEILDDPTLRRTLRIDVLRLEKWKVRLFFTALKFRAHWLCCLLLKYKMRSVD